MIETAGQFLKSLEGARLQGGPAANEFNKLFDFGDGKKSGEIDFANPDDDDLNSLVVE
jgi:hypothetical protein